MNVDQRRAGVGGDTANGFVQRADDPQRADVFIPRSQKFGSCFVVLLERFQAFASIEVYAGVAVVDG
jgi:hypothetical protein